MPMIFTILSAIVWLCAPIIFTPLPGIGLLKQDIKGLGDFIIAPLPQDTGFGKEALANRNRALRDMTGLQLALKTPAAEQAEAPADGVPGSDVELTPEQINQGEKAALRKPEEMRSLSEWGFTQELQEHRSRSFGLRFLMCVSSTLQVLLLLALVNGNILDHLYPFIFVFFLRWIFVVISFSRDANNFISFFTLASWLIVPVISSFMIGQRSYDYDTTELCVTLFVFMWILNALRQWYLLIHCGAKETGQRQDQLVRYAHYFFCGSDVETLAAAFVLCLHTIVSLLMIVLELACCRCMRRGAHTWWLLNSHVADGEVTYNKKKFQPRLQATWKQNSAVGENLGQDQSFFLQRPQR